MKIAKLGPTEAALEHSWAIASRTPIVVVPATIAAAVWAITLAVVEMVHAAADQAILGAFVILYAATACAVAFATTFAAAQIADVRSVKSGWSIACRRAIPAMLTILVLGVLGGAMAYVLRSFFAAWFVCTFLFMYAVPMVVAEERNWLVSLYSSARLAVRRLGTTLLTAILIEVIAALALAVAYLLSGLPYVGPFLQSLVLQFAFGFFAVFALEQFTTVADVRARVPASSAPCEGSTVPTHVHYPQAS